MEYAECLYTGKRHHCNLFQCLYQHPKCIRVVLGKAAKSTEKLGGTSAQWGQEWDCSLLEHTCDGSIPSMRDKSSWAWFMWWQKWVFDGQCKPIGWIGLSLWRRYRIYQIMESCSKQVCVATYLLVLTLNILCIFEGLWLHQFWMVQAGWASLQVSETTGKRETFLNDHP